MVMARWDPIREIRRMQGTMDRLWRTMSPEFDAGDIEAWTTPMDIVETQDNVRIRAVVPGVEPQDINVSVEDNVLTITAERREEHEQQDERYLMRESGEGICRRSVRLPNVLDSEKAESQYENGVLTITFPKQEQKKARRIEIRPGRQQLTKEHKQANNRPLNLGGSPRSACPIG
jgi:HSP20 family protein